MKMNDLKKRLRETALNEMPDVLHKIDLDSIDIIPELEEEKKSFWNLHRIMNYSFSLLFLGILSFSLITLLSNDHSTSFIPLQTEEQLISFQAISAVSFLEEMNPVPLSLNVSPLTDNTSSVIENEMDTVNEYLNMMETVLGDTDTMVSVSLDSDILDYNHYVIYRNIDLIGNLIEFKIYYNVHQDGEENFLYGVVYHGDNEYEITGKMNAETNTLSEITSYIDESNYVTVTDLSDESGQKFMYQQYASAQLKNQGTVALSLSQNVLNASVDTSSSSSTLKMNVSRVRVENTSRLQVQYQVTSGAVSDHGEFEVGVEYNQELGMYHYKYYMIINNATQEFVCGRGYKGNKQASEDDFTVTGKSTPADNTHGHHGHDNSQADNSSSDSFAYNNTQNLMSL